MFVWDFFAFTFSTNDDYCSEIFSGNTFFRQLLCFFFKLITMQLTPCAIYYIIYHQKKNQFYENYKETTNQKDLAINFLDDDASDFNRTLASRVDSRASLFSDQGSRPNQGSQYL
jgi:predicted membrane protein